MIADPDQLYRYLVENLIKICSPYPYRLKDFKRELSKDIYKTTPIVPDVWWQIHNRASKPGYTGVCPESRLVKPDNIAYDGYEAKYEKYVVINSADGWGWTPLSYLCRFSYENQNLDKIKLLIQNGANPNYHPPSLYVLLEAPMVGYTNETTIKYLLDHGADVNRTVGYIGDSSYWDVLTNVDPIKRKKIFNILLMAGLGFKILKRAGLDPIKTYRDVLKHKRSIHFTRLNGTTYPNKYLCKGRPFEIIMRLNFISLTN